MLIGRMEMTILAKENKAGLGADASVSWKHGAPTASLAVRDDDDSDDGDMAWMFDAAMLPSSKDRQATSMKAKRAAEIASGLPPPQPPTKLPKPGKDIQDMYVAERALLAAKQTMAALLDDTTAEAHRSS